MIRMILTIALGTWMLNASSQEISENTSSQSIASLLNEQPEKEKRKSVQSLTIGCGPAWISSKVYTPRDVYTMRTGIEMMAEYECVYSRGLGFGVMIAYNHTNYPDDCKIAQLFLGPSLVYAGYIGKRCWAKVDVGLGYATCDDDGYSIQSGVGFKSGLAFTYMISPKLGVGVHLLSLTSSFGEQSNNYPGSEDDVNGIARFGVSVGLRFQY